MLIFINPLINCFVDVDQLESYDDHSESESNSEPHSSESDQGGVPIAPREITKVVSVPNDPSEMVI